MPYASEAVANHQSTLRGGAPPAVRVRDLAISYRTTHEPLPLLSHAIARRLGRAPPMRHVDALRGVSFDVPHGSVLGIIGANGAGKSTLLRAVAGILPPTSGRIEVRGRISTLLAVGVGFNKSLSGRENVVLGALAAGIAPGAIDSLYPRIAQLADLGEFMDMPMKTYSSGMQSRLGFALAVSMEPDILLMDEALAAGDAAFKARTADRMRGLCANAGTILLVSHGLGTIKDLATHCIWLHKGQIMSAGDPVEVVADYMAFVQIQQSSVVLEDV